MLSSRPSASMLHIIETTKGSLDHQDPHDARPQPFKPTSSPPLHAFPLPFTRLARCDTATIPSSHTSSLLSSATSPPCPNDATRGLLAAQTSRRFATHTEIAGSATLRTLCERSETTTLELPLLLLPSRQRSFLDRRSGARAIFRTYCSSEFSVYVLLAFRYLKLTIA
jgi:hypothetical protein